MTKIAGKNVGLYISTNLTTPDYKLAVCGLSHTFSRTRDTVDTSSKCDDGNGNAEPGKASYTISMDGYGTKDPSVGQMSINAIDDIHLAGNAFLWKLADSATAPVAVGYQGQGILTRFEETYPDNESGKFTIEILGQGTYVNLL